MDYSIDYSGERPEQSGVVAAAPEYDHQQLANYRPPRRHHRVPNIVTTIAAIAATFWPCA